MKSLILVTILLTMCASVHAHDYHHSTTINNYYTNGTATALAVAAPQYDMNVDGLQVGLGTGYYDDGHGNENGAFAVGIGKRICFKESCGIFNATIGINEGGGEGFNVGITWKL